VEFHGIMKGEMECENIPFSNPKKPNIKNLVKYSTNFVP
jgi:hypothetical protein